MFNTKPFITIIKMFIKVYYFSNNSRCLIFPTDKKKCNKSSLQKKTTKNFHICKCNFDALAQSFNDLELLKVSQNKEQKKGTRIIIIKKITLN